jgi:hypothetical protein
VSDDPSTGQDRGVPQRAGPGSRARWSLDVDGRERADGRADREGIRPRIGLVGVIALDAGATARTVADGIAPHPTLSEAIKGASLAALGRAIDLPNRKHAFG